MERNPVTEGAESPPLPDTGMANESEDRGTPKQAPPEASDSSSPTWFRRVALPDGRAALDELRLPLAVEEMDALADALGSEMVRRAADTLRGDVLVTLIALAPRARWLQRVAAEWPALSQAAALWIDQPVRSTARVMLAVIRILFGVRAGTPPAALDSAARTGEASAEAGSPEPGKVKDELTQ